MTESNSERALVIGASSGIAQALIEQLLQSASVTCIDAVSRSLPKKDFGDSVQHFEVDSSHESQIKAFISARKAEGITYRYVVCTIGFLHNAELAIKPEKRLEDINADAMQHYFAVNTIMPTLWLKNLPAVVAKNAPTTMAFFSARVGSISDNRLGGWYGYRASKAALNMLVKTASVEYRRRVKDSVLVCYHPGTVDTALSKPFQKNVAAEKLFTADFTASQLITHLPKLDREQACHFIDWRGEVVTW